MASEGRLYNSGAKGFAEIWQRERRMALCFGAWRNRRGGVVYNERLGDS